MRGQDGAPRLSCPEPVCLQGPAPPSHPSLPGEPLPRAPQEGRPVPTRACRVLGHESPAPTACCGDAAGCLPGETLAQPGAEGVSLAQTPWTGVPATCRSGSCGRSTSTGCPLWARPSRSWAARSCAPCQRSSFASAPPWAGTCCTPTWTSGNQVGPRVGGSRGRGRGSGQGVCWEVTLRCPPPGTQPLVQLPPWSLGDRQPWPSPEDAGQSTWGVGT